MKKIAILLTVILSLSLSMVAFAATTDVSPSVDKDGNPATEAAKTLAKGVEAKATVNGVEVRLEKAAPKAEHVSAAASEAIKQVGAGAEVKSMVDLALPAGVTIPAEGLDISIEAPSVVAGGNYTILHYNGSIWEKIVISKVEAGKITGRFFSLSPVAIVANPTTPVGDASTTPSTTTPGTTTSGTTTTSSTAPVSPKTADANPMMNVIILAGVFVVAFGATRFFSKKSTRA